MSGKNPYAKALGGSQPSKPKSAPGASKRAASDPQNLAKAQSNGTQKLRQAGTPSGTGGTIDKDALEREVLALGGDEAEVEMLLALESESEMEDDAGDQSHTKEDKKSNAALSKELKSFMKGLDFAAVGGAAVADEDDDNDDDDDQDETEDDEDESEDDQDEEDEDDETEDEAEAEAVEEVPEPAQAQLETPTTKKESKHEREERRRLEREQAKEALKAEKEKAHLVVEEAPRMPKLKTPWIVDPTPQWYAVPVPGPSSLPRPSPNVVTQLATRAEELLKKENDLYASSLAPAAKGTAPPPPNGLSKSDQVFIQQILSSGTSSDRVSALLLLVASSPLHTMSYLDQLSNLAKKKSRDQSGRAVRGIIEWWRGDGGEGGGAPSRKLRAFVDQPGLSAVAASYEAFERGKGKKKADEGQLSQQEMDQALVVYAFEDWLKKWFFGVLQALEQMSLDNLPHPRQLAVLHLSGLLRDKPEQESNILRLLVNKLGDSNRNIASKTSHHLLQILQVHPGMTPIIVREISGLILKPTAASSAAPAAGKHIRFGASKEDDKPQTKKPRDSAQEHARYYGIITLNQIMLQKGQTEVANRLTEVYFEVFGDILGRIEDEGDKVVDVDGDAAAPLKRKRGDKGKKGAKDGDKLGEVDESESKIVAAVLTGVNRAFPFAQIEDEAVKKRLDTLYRITHSGTFNVSIQALMLIFRVSSAKRDISDRFYRTLYASLHDPRLGPSSKQALYLNLLFKAIKQDKQLPRVMAFVKRLVQVMLGLDVVFILGSLFIVGELMSSTPGLFEMLIQPEKAKVSEADEAETYDGRKREPLGAHADKSCLWEITPLLHHWHPTVVQNASLIMSGQPLSATAELEQHSLNHFLDRFVYRDLKKNLATKGTSMMQPGVPGQDRTGRIVVMKGAMRGEEAVVNSESFRRKDVSKVPVDQLFFHKYFTSKASLGDDKRQAALKRKAHGTKGGDDELDGSDAESIDDLVEEGDDQDFEALAEAMEDISGGEDEQDDDDVEFDMVDAADDGGSVDADEDEIWEALKKSARRSGEDGTDEMDSDALPDLDDEEFEEDDEDEDLAAYDYDDSDEDLAVDKDLMAVDDDDEVAVDEDEFVAETPFESLFEDAPEDDDEEGDDDEDDAGLLEDEDDLIGSDEDVPVFGDDDNEEEEDDDAAPVKGKGGRTSGADNKNKKRKLKHMPTFATAEDYAHLLGDSDDEEL